MNFIQHIPALLTIYACIVVGSVRPSSSLELATRRQERQVQPSMPHTQPAIENEYSPLYDDSFGELPFYDVYGIDYNKKPEPESQFEPQTLEPNESNPQSLDPLEGIQWQHIFTMPPNKNESEYCECVPSYLCPDNLIVTDGTGLLDVRIFTCEDKSQVCCQKKPVTETITPTPIINFGCGKRNPDGVNLIRITGLEDNEAQFGEFPWMVAVLENQEHDGRVLERYHCGGSLIHPQAVITAAHCVHRKRPNDFIIRAGEWDTLQDIEIFPHQERQVSKIIIHEKYYAGGVFNDVALLILDQPVDIAENVDVVCLPDQGERFDHSQCVASGWGKDKFGVEGQLKAILSKIDLSIVPRDQCEEALRKTRLGPYFKLHESFICAGGEAGKDTCKGDGGSPLVCPLLDNPEIYAQVGIVSWGIGCGQDRIPGVYANVPLFRSWIDKQLRNNGLN